MKISRRSFLKLGGVSAAAVAGGGVYTRFIEAEALEMTVKKIPLGLSQRIRVLHLSDFHASSCVPWSLIQRSVEMGMATHPDLVFLTGDFITSRKNSIDGYPKALAALKDHPNCFACLGNHDGKYASRQSPSVGQRLEQTLGGSGVRLLHNRSTVVHVKGIDIEVAGLGDLWSKEVEPAKCLKRAGSTPMPTLLLAHNPDTKSEVEDYHWNVMFSGHTHGGQVVLPVFNWAPALPVKDRSMIAGHYPWKDRHIHITRGVGNLHGVRFNCPPEVSVVDLV